MSKTSVKAMPLKSILRNDLTVAYKPLLDATGAAGLPAACFMLMITNDTATVVSISFDGVTIHDKVVAHGMLPIYVQMNSQPNAKEALFDKGLIIYVSAALGVAAGESVWCSGYYV